LLKRPAANYLAGDVTRPGFFRSHGLLLLVATVLLLSLAAGYAADRVATDRRSPIERAEAIAQTGRLDAAERVYLTLAEERPADVPLLVALLDNHDRLVRQRLLRSVPDPDDELPAPALAAPVDEERIDAVLASPALSGDAKLLVRWWRLVLADADDATARHDVVTAATRQPPAPWANHLLGRAAEREGNEALAAEAFAHEAEAFGDRRDDAAAACHFWIESGDWNRLGEALAEAQFAHQVPAGVFLENAIARHHWLAAARWFVLAHYEGATAGIWLLAALSGLVWFAFCAVVGRIGERPALRAPLFAAAFALGVGSTYLVIALSILEENVLHFVENGQAAADVIYYVLGVGLREELSKALFVLPLCFVIKRWGTRRDALACGALVGLGFAVEENVGYFQLGLSTALARFLTANFLHLSTTGIVAVAIDDAMRGHSERHERLDGWTQTLPLVVVTHGVYDFFLSNAAPTGASFASMLTFFLLARRFVNVLRELPGREGPLLPMFLVGLAVVAGGTFIYASTLVGVAHAAVSIAVGALGLAIIALVFGREFGSVTVLRRR
jgi:RsiW-degrading membrane proteinase PrsW (M82 family)